MHMYISTISLNYEKYFRIHTDRKNDMLFYLFIYLFSAKYSLWFKTLPRFHSSSTFRGRYPIYRNMEISSTVIYFARVCVMFFFFHIHTNVSTNDIVWQHCSYPVSVTFDEQYSILSFPCKCYLPLISNASTQIREIYHDSTYCFVFNISEN